MAEAIIYTDFNTPQHALSFYHSGFSNIHRHRKCLVPDLHGSFIKLISVLIHLEFITYRIEPQVVHNWLIAMRDEIDQCIGVRYPTTNQETFKVNLIGALNENFCLACTPERLLNTEIIFLGDVFCDRGTSDLITLIVFFWMTLLGIQYCGLCGNHDLLMCSGSPFSDYPEQYFAGLSQGTQRGFFSSFDYFQLNQEMRSLFQELLMSYVQKLKLFIVEFEPLPAMLRNPRYPNLNFLPHSPVLLTHAPCRREDLVNIIQLLDVDASQMNPLHLFSQKTSKAAQDYLNTEFLQNVFMAGMITPPYIRSLELITRIDAVEQFCSNRDFSKPLFSHPREGKNIFGHMGADAFPHTTLQGLSPSQKCLDHATGMPQFPSGFVEYAFL